MADLIGGVVVGVLVGLVFGWLWWRGRFFALRAERDAARGTAIAEITQASAVAAAEQAALQFRQIEQRAEDDAAVDLERRRAVLETSVADLVRPVKEQIEQYQLRVESLQSTSTKLHGELQGEIERLANANAGLARETNNLVSALRRPEVRGGWGEQQLRRIVELAGMVEHCDFDEQVQLTGATGATQRPDMIVHLPNSREVIVDAKVPLDAYLEAIAAKDEATREECTKRHAAQLRTHVDTLAKRAYQHGHAGSVDFVVAFIPGDPLLAAAYEYDPSIFERALAEHVIIATPTTLIALLKAVAYGWQQEAVAHNAEEIASAGRELYRRLFTVSNHLGKLGKQLQSAVGAYNEFMGSLERRVLPKARQFENLGLIGPADAHLPESFVITELPQRPIAPELTDAMDEEALG